MCQNHGRDTTGAVEESGRDISEDGEEERLKMPSSPLRTTRSPSWLMRELAVGSIK
jgi:hypothetical protein